MAIGNHCLYIIMASLLLRASSMRVAAAKTSFLSVKKAATAAAFTVLPDSTYRSSSLQQQQQNRRPFASFQKAKRPPKLYSRKTVRKMGKTGKMELDKLYRADRVLANRSAKSRSECFDLLQDKRVWQLAVSSSANDNKEENGEDDSGQRKVLVKGPSVKISMDTPLWIDRTEEVALPPPLLQVYHKPIWVLSVRRDPTGRPCLDSDSLSSVSDMHPVGRLDYDTSGLLLFSSSGPLTQTLLHPKHETPKEYVATVTGRVDEDKLRAQFTAGVTTGEGVHTADLLKVEHWDDTDNNNSNSDRPTVAAFLQQIKTGLPAEYNQTDLKVRGYLDVFDATELTTVTLAVHEGKHRMVRRMLANTGHAVVALKRERLGVITLGDLPVGETRRLNADETKWAEQQLRPKSKKGRGKKKKMPVDDDSSE